MGDVLFQVVFHARLAEEVGAFTMQDVITDVSRKLIHRHPHVYGTVTVGSAEELLKNWDALKAEEKKERKSALDGIARDLPSLMRPISSVNGLAAEDLTGPMQIALMRRSKRKKTN